MNKRGFTLAEVLITLIVIGVISALTIPNILQNTQDAQLKAAFKKVYSDLDQATKRLVMDNSGSLVGVFTDPDGGGILQRSDNCRDKYLQYLSFVRKCDMNDADIDTDSNGDYYIISNCWNKYNYFFNKKIGYSTDALSSQAILSNGALIDFYISTTDCTNDYSYNFDGSLLGCGRIMVDVNGTKSPNQYGKDIFFILITQNNLRAEGTQSDSSYGQCVPTATDFNGTGYGCAALVLQNKDY